MHGSIRFPHLSSVQYFSVIIKGPKQVFRFFSCAPCLLQKTPLSQHGHLEMPTISTVGRPLLGTNPTDSILSKKGDNKGDKKGGKKGDKKGDKKANNQGDKKGDSKGEKKGNKKTQ